MILEKALEKADSLQHLVGTSDKGKDDIKIEMVIAAPVDDNYFVPFINEVKWVTANGGNIRMIKELAAKLPEQEFNVVKLYEGTFHENLIQMSGDILFGWYEN